VCYERTEKLRALRQARLLPLIIGHALWNVVLIGLPALMATLRSAQ
jgi:hypothetical protein